MKKLLIISLYFSLLGVCYGQRCHGKYEALVSKGDTIIIKCKDAVLMNGETYADYYYKGYELKAFKELVPDYKVKIDSVEKELRRNGEDYVAVLSKKDSVISIVEADRLQLRGLLKDCNAKYKREKIKKEQYRKKLARARIVQYSITVGCIIILLL